MADGEADGSRRAVVMSAMLTPLALTAGSAVAQDTRSLSIAMVSRERLLQEVVAARDLQAAERRMAAALQSVIDRTRSELEDEERELARNRSSMAAEAFAARTRDFDARMRTARRETQERGARLQRAFQSARAKLVAGLPVVLERVRIEAGIDLLIDADLVLAARADLDLTRAAVELHDRTVQIEIPPDLAVDTPLIGPDRDADTTGNGNQ